MVEQSFPFSGISPGDAGAYTAAFFAEFLAAVLRSSYRANAGVFLESGDGTLDPLSAIESTPAGMRVTVNPGSALVNGRWYENTGLVDVDLVQNVDGSGDNRIDVIVLELNTTTQEVRLSKVQGTVAPTPVAPALTQTSVTWQIPLAYVDVINLAGSIVTADITNAPYGLGAGHVGDIKGFAGEAASFPYGWVECDGTEYNGLYFIEAFAVLGTAYGSSGANLFEVDDLRGRVTVGAGTGAGLTARARGDSAGEEDHQLTEAELPAHTHSYSEVIAGAAHGGSGEIDTQVGATGSIGSDNTHNNMQPYGVARTIIRLF